MRSSALAHSSLALVLALALAACGGAETAPPADGGGSSVDGGSPRADGGTARDGGTTSDGGTAADGGPIVVPTCPSGGGATVTRWDWPEAVRTSYSPGSPVSRRARPLVSQRTCTTAAGGTGPATKSTVSASVPVRWRRLPAIV